MRGGKRLGSGRPPIEETLKRKQVGFLLTEAEKSLLKEAAKLRNETFTEYVRIAALQRAEDDGWEMSSTLP